MNTEHAEMVWYQAVHLQTVFQYQMRHLPLLTGLALAAAQFVPELLGRRTRACCLAASGPGLASWPLLASCCCIPVGASRVAPWTLRWWP